MEELQNTTESLGKTNLSLDKSGLLQFKNRIYIPDSTELKLTVLDGVHNKPYSGSSRITKNDNNTKKVILLA
jgi:hypothetical protein